MRRTDEVGRISKKNLEGGTRGGGRKSYSLNIFTDWARRRSLECDLSREGKKEGREDLAARQDDAKENMQGEVR